MEKESFNTQNELMLIFLPQNPIYYFIVVHDKTPPHTQCNNDKITCRYFKYMGKKLLKTYNMHKSLK